VPLGGGEPWYRGPGFRSFFLNASEPDSPANISSWSPAFTTVRGPMFLRSLKDSLVPTTIFTVSMALITTLVVGPFFPQYFLQALNFVGPVMLLSVICSAVQWRVFGPITSQLLLSIDQLSFNSERWHWIYCSSLIAAMVLLPWYYTLRGNSHRFYRRSLRRAFFAGGREITWGELRSNRYCPVILVSATVTDYMVPGDKHPCNPISFSPLHIGSDKLGFVAAKASSSVSKAMAMSGAAPDAVILARSQHMRQRFWLEVVGIGVGAHVQFDIYGRHRKNLLTRALRRHWGHTPDCVYRLPTVLLWELVYGLLLVSELVSYRYGHCQWGKRCFLLGFGIAALMVVLSFFAFVPQLDFLLHSQLIRTIHQVTGYYHKARWPPSLLYITDGMVEDNTGVMDLLRRRCERILLVYAGADNKDEFKFLRKILECAAAERLASIYDPADPRCDVGVALERYRKDVRAVYLRLDILYGWDCPPEERKLGHLFILKLHVPHDQQDMLAQPLLTEAEIRGEAGSGAEDASTCSESSEGSPLRSLRARDLSGCCCDCCHRRGWRCGSMFPHPPTGMQFLTPQVASTLCRLGHGISGDVVAALRAA